MESAVKSKLDNVWIGVGLGIVASILFYFLYAFIWAMINGMTSSEFYDQIFMGFEGYFTSKIITICALSNVILFYIFLKKNYLQLCKGLLAVLVITLPIVIYFY
ncbi:MAG: hypothetical protein SGI87_00225 [Flavobacteriales bacterium]|nr:hypothetical protein [Flavobacteriales bacterium]